MNAEVNPEMLILGREVRAMTQIELAQATSIDQGLLSKYERGVRPITESDLQKVSVILDLPTAFFCRKGERTGLYHSSVYHRSQQSISSVKQKEIVARLDLLRMDIQRLLDGVEIESAYKFPQYDPEDYDYNIEQIAGMVRAAWEIPSGPISSVAASIENAGGIIYLYNLGTPKADAFIQRSQRPPYIPIFLVNSEVPGDRLRFTLAHEIGHLVMHMLPVSDMEDQADAFAAAFLMPARDIAHEFSSKVTLASLAQMKPRWRVSIQALMRRALDLGKITDRQYKSLVVEMNKLGYRKHEPYEITQDKPRLLKDLVEIHINEYGYTPQELSELMPWHERELKSLYVTGTPNLRVMRQVPKQSKTAG